MLLARAIWARGEMADTYASGAYAVRRGGSSPLVPTKDTSIRERRNIWNQLFSTKIKTY
jgi:hypothetical protein